jgi:fructokinase
VVVADTVGAGDSFGAALIAALYEQGALELGSARALDQSSLTSAAGYAVTAAAITATRPRAVPPTRSEIDGWRSPTEKGAASSD